MTEIKTIDDLINYIVGYIKYAQQPLFYEDSTSSQKATARIFVELLSEGLEKAKELKANMEKQNDRD